MSDWWHGVEEALAATSADAPDPWAHLDAALPALTDEQRAFLEQVATQPAPVRLSLDDEPLDDALDGESLDGEPLDDQASDVADSA